MRAGRHYAQFTVVSRDRMFFGVIRPEWDVERAWGAQGVDSHCFYYTVDGYRCPSFRDWEGIQDAREEGDRIGMLLDLDQGSMTVYKNDERLGVMATDLSAAHCWAVEKRSVCSARIESAAAPASPSVEELAYAVAYEATRKTLRACCYVAASAELSSVVSDRQQQKPMALLVPKLYLCCSRVSPTTTYHSSL